MHYVNSNDKGRVQCLHFQCRIRDRSRSSFWLRTTFSVGFHFCLKIILERAIIIHDLSRCTRGNSYFPQRQLLNFHWRFLKEPRSVLRAQVLGGCSNKWVGASTKGYKYYESMLCCSSSDSSFMKWTISSCLWEDWRQAHTWDECHAGSLLSRCPYSPGFTGFNTAWSIV